ncbi:ATP-dependent DNA ligase [Cellulomonas soli]
MLATPAARTHGVHRTADNPHDAAPDTAADDPPVGLPTGPEWAYEVKWDGVRILTDTRTGTLHLTSRTGADVTATYPELGGLATLQDAVLDGEIVLMAAGLPSFTALAARMHVHDARRAQALAARAPVTYVVFDVLFLHGTDLRRRPWHGRRTILDGVSLPEHVQRSPVYQDGTVLWQATRAQGLEGVLAKRTDSPYQEGRRSPDWVKAAHVRTRTALVVGWREEAGGHGTLGAVLLAAPDERGTLRYLGRVGSGLTGAMAIDLHRLLLRCTRDVTVLEEAVSAADARGTHWCDPVVLVDARYHSRTPTGRLRQPVLRGVRTDVPPDAWERP